MTTTKVTTRGQPPRRPLSQILQPSSVASSFGVGICNTSVGPCYLTTQVRPSATRRSATNTILGSVVVGMGGGRGGIPDPIVDILSTSSEVVGN